MKEEEKINSAANARSHLHYVFFSCNFQRVLLSKLAVLINHLPFQGRRKIMNKGDLVNEVAKVVNTKKEAQAAVDCVFSAITKTLKKKDTVALVGFGTFKVAQRKARKGRNPQTGAEIRISAKKVPKFVPGKALKDAVS